MPGGRWIAWDGAEEHDCRGLNASSAPQAVVAEVVQSGTQEEPAPDDYDEVAEPEPPAPPRPRAIFGPLPERIEPRRPASRPVPPETTADATVGALAEPAGEDAETDAETAEEEPASDTPTRPGDEQFFYEPQRVPRKRRAGTMTLALLTTAAALVAAAYLAFVGINAWIAGSAWAALPENDRWYCWSAGIPMPHEATGASDERLCTDSDVKDVRNFLWPRILPDPWR